MAPLLTAIRTRATLLIDRLEWERFDEWVATEMRLGVLLMREAMERGQAAGTMTADQVLEIDKQLHTWVAAFTNNLRLFRRLAWRVWIRSPTSRDARELTPRR